MLLLRKKVIKGVWILFFLKFQAFSLEMSSWNPWPYEGTGTRPTECICGLRSSYEDTISYAGIVVIPAKAGIQKVVMGKSIDSRWRHSGMTEQKWEEV